MFVSNLNIQQQSYLLELSRLVMSIDGKVLDSELAVFETIKSQCKTSLMNVDEPMADLLNVFDSTTARVSLMLELLGVAHADADYDESERNLVKQVSEALDIGTEKLKEMEDWVVKQFGLLKEANLLMES